MSHADWNKRTIGGQVVRPRGCIDGCDELARANDVKPTAPLASAQRTRRAHGGQPAVPTLPLAESDDAGARRRADHGSD